MTAASLGNIFKHDKNATVLPLKGSIALNRKSPEFATLLVDPNYPLREGRGVYWPLEEHPGRYLYVKGAGNNEALKSSHSMDDWRKFRGIGHYDLSKYFLDKLPQNLPTLQTGPRVRGALTLPFAVKEFINANVFQQTLSRLENIVSDVEARKMGLTIPVAVIDSPGIAAEVMQTLQKFRPDYKCIDLQKGNNPIQYGMVVLEVPAAHRIRSSLYSGVSQREFYREILACPDRMELVGTTMKQQLACGFISLSTHYQNIYHAPGSICPQADNSDLVPISEILEYSYSYGYEPEKLLRSLVMKQLEYAPFKLLNSEEPEIQELAVASIARILSVLAPDIWDETECLLLAYAFRAYPHSTLAGIADQLIKNNFIESRPQANWESLYDQHACYAFDVLAMDHVKQAMEISTEFERRLIFLENQAGN